VVLVRGCVTCFVLQSALLFFLAPGHAHSVLPLFCRVALIGESCCCCRVVYLHVITYNLAAIAFYKSNGFRLVATLRNFYFIGCAGRWTLCIGQHCALQHQPPQLSWTWFGRRQRNQ
jgi:hypothetical protein